MLKFYFINRIRLHLTFRVYFFNYDLSFTHKPTCTCIILVNCSSFCCSYTSLKFNVLFPKIGAPKSWGPRRLPTCMSPMPGAGVAAYDNPSGVEIRPESSLIGSRDQLRHSICQAKNRKL